MSETVSELVSDKASYIEASLLKIFNSIIMRNAANNKIRVSISPPLIVDFSGDTDMELPISVYFIF